MWWFQPFSVEQEVRKQIKLADPISYSLASAYSMSSILHIHHALRKSRSALATAAVQPRTSSGGPLCDSSSQVPPGGEWTCSEVNEGLRKWDPQHAGPALWPATGAGSDTGSAGQCGLGDGGHGGAIREGALSNSARLKRAFPERHPLQATRVHASICVEAVRVQLWFPEYLTQLCSFQMWELESWEERFSQSHTR